MFNCSKWWWEMSSSSVWICTRSNIFNHIITCKYCFQAQLLLMVENSSFSRLFSSLGLVTLPNLTTSFLRRLCSNLHPSLPPLFDISRWKLYDKSSFIKIFPPLQQITYMRARILRALLIFPVVWWAKKYNKKSNFLLRNFNAIKMEKFHSRHVLGVWQRKVTLLLSESRKRGT